MHTFKSLLDLALTYALRRPALALAILVDAHRTAVTLGRPDLGYETNTLIIVIRS